MNYKGISQLINTFIPLKQLCVAFLIILSFDDGKDSTSVLDSSTAFDSVITESLIEDLIYNGVEDTALE